MGRSATLTRTTSETDIALTINLDGEGSVEAKTGVGFFDHMLNSFGRHGLFDLSVSCDGDTEVDFHHTVEDAGIVLGQAVAEALGDKVGISRFSDATIAMDEALVLVAIDVSGRGQLYWDVDIPTAKIGDFDTELVKEFFIGFARDAGITLHIRKLAGENSHHIVEACFKAFGRALRAAAALDPRVAGVPSTKGSL